MTVVKGMSTAAVVCAAIGVVFSTTNSVWLSAACAVGLIVRMYIYDVVEAAR